MNEDAVRRLVDSVVAIRNAATVRDESWDPTIAIANVYRLAVDALPPFEFPAGLREQRPVPPPACACSRAAVLLSSCCGARMMDLGDPAGDFSERFGECRGCKRWAAVPPPR